MNDTGAVTSPGAGCLIQASDTRLQSKLPLFLTPTGKAKETVTGKFLAEGKPPRGWDHKKIRALAVTRSSLPRYS